ncbi:MAG: hypothetical protein ACREJ2_03250, partial [Planctomycetota bacterium]
MKLGVLYDPNNPLIPAAQVVEGLRRHAEVVPCTFERFSHRTQPNATFAIRPFVEQERLDALLWIEGGPLPADLSGCSLRKVAWMINGHIEPSLLTDLEPLFNCTCLPDKARVTGPTRRWLPLCATGERLRFAPGVHVMGQDPMPPSQLALIRTLDGLASQLQPAYPIVVCPGSRGNPHPALYDVLQASAVALVGPETDLRDIAWPEEHLFQYHHPDELPKLLQDLCRDTARVGHVAQRAPEI